MTAGWMRVRIAQKQIEALDICSFELVDPEGGALPPFSAGSHIDVKVAPGLVRPYSLCNDPAERHRYVIGVLRDPRTRGGSKAMHDELHCGDVIEISAPRNHFALAQGAQRSLLIAGGIGVTPILCMAEQLSTMGAAFEMHYCTRAPERTAFAERARASSFGDRVHFHFDNGAPEQLADFSALLAQHHAAAHLYVCGPRAFMDHVLDTARRAGWPEAQLHYEFFTVRAPRADASAFEVKLAKSGRILRIPGDRTVLEVLSEAGAELPSSCEVGTCGTCLTRVLEGEPDHRDFFLTPDEQAANDVFLPCCSRSKSACLVLDL
jgi:vanillate O-demethylase ferredoxin subunit